MKRFISITAILIGTLLNAGAAHAQEKVRLAYAVQIHQANMMVIQDYAKAHGISLEITPLRRYADLQLALNTKQVDMAVLGYVNIGLMEESGFKDYKAVAGVFTGGQSLTLRNGVVAASWKDLEGKRIGTSPNSYSELLFKASAKAGGADLSKIKTVSFPSGGPPIISALAAGDIDGFVSWEPSNADAVVGKAGTYSSLDIGANATRHVNGALLVNADFAAAHEQAVVSVVRALVESTDALNADKARYAEVAQRGTGSSAQVVKEAIAHGTLDYKLYAKEAKALLGMIHAAGITKTDTSSAVDRQFDYSFLMKATGKSRQELGGE